MKKEMLSQSFVRGGYIRPWYGSARHLDYGSNYWSSTALPTVSDTYHQYFNDGGVYSSDGNNRARGFSVRCLAR